MMIIKYIIGLLALLTVATSFADSSSIPVPAGYQVGTSTGYVLATGIYFPPSPITSNLSTTLYMSTPNNQQCAAGTIPTVSIAFNYFNSQQNWQIGTISMATYQYGTSSNVWSGYSTAQWLTTGQHSNQYAIGLSLGYENGSAWWESIGVAWTLYCIAT